MIFVFPEIILIREERILNLFTYGSMLSTRVFLIFDLQILVYEYYVSHCSIPKIIREK